ncbi:hypothetical protein IQ276_021015 [Desmonostoc muscorum LEGE 12446]|uniref:hypothetical protein n=1 Tax=Desmonostoc muscorum TaxID=1179 RepID=UPI001D139CA7|nr:hypothetical protein [Desmonostoc muscorum]MCF2148861.1 hypothetical protein [Desmonostoc muscorum LEGE 12446]
MRLRWIAVGLGITISIICSVFTVVNPAQSKVPQLNNGETTGNELEIVKTRADLVRLNGQKVKLIGRYISRSWKPDPKFTGIPGFQGLYIKAHIILEDGVEVNIFPSWNKQSLRSPEEAEEYNHQMVEAVGVVQFEATLTPNSQIRESFINLAQLRPHLQETKTNSLKDGYSNPI